MDFDAIKRSRQVATIRRAVDFIEAGNEAMTILLNRRRFQNCEDTEALAVQCDPGEMQQVALELSDLAEEMERQ